MIRQVNGVKHRVRRKQTAVIRPYMQWRTAAAIDEFEQLPKIVPQRLRVERIRLSRGLLQQARRQQSRTAAESNKQNAIHQFLHGLDGKRDPGPPIVGNAYEQTEARTLFWRDTIADFMASGFAAEAFGAEFQHIFGQQKLKEMRSFYTEVTTLEYDWYLRQV